MQKLVQQISNGSQQFYVQARDDIFARYPYIYIVVNWFQKSKKVQISKQTFLADFSIL